MRARGSPTPTAVFIVATTESWRRFTPGWSKYSGLIGLFDPFI